MSIITDHAFFNSFFTEDTRIYESLIGEQSDYRTNLPFTITGFLYSVFIIVSQQEKHRNLYSLLQP